jgi:hypothetical protein
MMTRDDGFESEDNSSVFFHSSKEQHFETLELPDLFINQKHPLERLFETPSKQISKEKLFSGVYDSMTKKRMSDIMETIQKPQFEWPVKKEYPDDIDFLEDGMESTELRLNELLAKNESESSSFGISITSSFGDSMPKPRRNGSDKADKADPLPTLCDMEDVKAELIKLDLKEPAKVDGSKLDLEIHRRPPFKRDQAQTKKIANTTTNLFKESDIQQDSTCTIQTTKNTCDLSNKNLDSYNIPINPTITRMKM